MNQRRVCKGSHGSFKQNRVTWCAELQPRDRSLLLLFLPIHRMSLFTSFFNVLCITVQVCVRSGASISLPACSAYYTARAGDTCSSIIKAFNLTAFAFFTINPGLMCANLIPSISFLGGGTFSPIGSQVCTAG